MESCMRPPADPWQWPKPSATIERRATAVASVPGQVVQFRLQRFQPGRSASASGVRVQTPVAGTPSSAPCRPRGPAAVSIADDTECRRYRPDAWRRPPAVQGVGDEETCGQPVGACPHAGRDRSRRPVLPARLGSAQGAPAFPGAAAMTLELFRREALEARRGQWLGAVSLAQPLGLWLLTAAALLAASAVLLFLLLGTYTRRSTVSGQLVPTDGMAMVVAPATGVVVAVDVREGARVEAGQPLATVAVPRVTRQAGDTLAALEERLRRRREGLEAAMSRRGRSFRPRTPACGTSWARRARSWRRWRPRSRRAGRRYGLRGKPCIGCASCRTTGT